MSEASGMAESGTTAEVETAEAVAAEIVAWRLECLLRAGCDRRAAQKLAARLDVDLHQALGMLDHGCPPALAVRILA
jgi:hypothetical protein